MVGVFTKLLLYNPIYYSSFYFLFHYRYIIPISNPLNPNSKNSCPLELLYAKEPNRF